MAIMAHNTKMGTYLNMFTSGNSWSFIKCFENIGKFVKVNDLETRVKC